MVAVPRGTIVKKTIINTVDSKYHVSVIFAAAFESKDLVGAKIRFNFTVPAYSLTCFPFFLFFEAFFPSASTLYRSMERSASSSPFMTY